MVAGFSEDLVGAAAIARGMCRYLAEAGYGTLTEMTLATGRRVDIMALDRAGEILVIEIKSSLADFRADQKWREYLPYCDTFAFAVAADFPKQVLPEQPGLFVADAYGATALRAPPRAPLAAARRKALTIRFGLVAAARLQRREDPPL